MTSAVKPHHVQHWITTQVDQGYAQFTIHDLKAATGLLFQGQSFSLRSLYDITRQYVQMTGTQVQKRPRRNFNEQVFTPEQMTDILTVIDRHTTHHLSYAEAIREVKGLARDSSSGGPAPSAGQLTEELMALRSVVHDLHSEVRSLRALSLTRQDLWRSTMGTLLLSMPENQEHVRAIMAYMGVTDLDSEAEALRALGIDLPFDLSPGTGGWIRGD